MEMKTIKYFLMMVLVSLLNTSVSAGTIESLREQFDQVIGDPQTFLCDNVGFNQFGLFESSCGNPEISFTQDDLITLYTGRSIINTYGCGNNSYNSDPLFDNDGNIAIDQNDYHKYNVALLGDSLTHFGGFKWMWDAYLGTHYKVLPLGAAGSTSSAWREHFDHCEVSAPDWGFPPPDPGGRMQLPARSIMMIGGNDFHVFKGILQPMWWLVDLRHNSVLNNVERIITHHHKGNNGCGDKTQGGEVVEPLAGGCPDVDGNGVVNQADWGRGRLFVSLGNIPAVSIDPTDPKVVLFGPLHVLMLSLGLLEPLAYDVNSEARVGANKYETMNYLLYVVRRMLDSYVDVIMKPFAVIVGQSDKNHAWASREMHLLQNKTQQIQIRRGGFMYVHMYKHFRDGAADSRGCYWCADENLWMDENDFYSFGDGIHISHVKGYAKWAEQVVPAMAVAGMEDTERSDIFGPPGVEIVNRDEANDWWLIVGCFGLGYCRL